MNYCCPVCKKTLKLVHRTWVCENRHSFDLAKSGYVNLCRNFKASQGDNKEMVASRTVFLEKGYYQSLANEMVSLVKKLNPEVLFDCACGQGWYTKQLKQAITGEVHGFDMSREAILHASKKDKESHYAIASIFDLPAFSKSVDCITLIFAPTAAEEFHRVLKENGILITVSPGENHLFELKEAVYDHPYKNDHTPAVLPGFDLLEQRFVETEIFVDCPQDIQALFMMTPYTYKTSEQDMAKLKALQTLKTRVHFSICVYQKKVNFYKKSIDID